ncbi:hypothetical protein GCM10027203_40560 [Nonomuraea fastidiosa]
MLKARGFLSARVYAHSPAFAGRAPSRFGQLGRPRFRLLGSPVSVRSVFVRWARPFPSAE